MSVPENKRTESKFNVLVKAEELTVYTMQITHNPHKFDPTYDSVLTSYINSYALAVFMKCWEANGIAVGDSVERWHMRRSLQEDAARKCNSLLALIQIARKLFKISGRRFAHWTEMVIEVRTLIYKWKESDSKRYSHLG